MESRLRNLSNDNGNDNDNEEGFKASSEDYSSEESHSKDENHQETENENQTVVDDTEEPHTDNASHPYQEDELILELPSMIVSDDIVSSLTSNFKCKTVVLVLNHKYKDETIEVPIDLKDWEGTNLRLEKLLTDRKVSEEHRTILLNLLNSASSKITDHFIAREKHKWETVKKTRRQREAEESPKEVSISEAIRMHSGNVRVKGGMISGSAGTVEKMITRSYFRCGFCDTINELHDYTDLRPRFKHEVPATLGKKGKECANCSDKFGHELDYKVKNALRIELQDTETFSDLEKLSVILFDDCTKNVSIGEQVIVTGSIYKIAIHNKLLTFLFATSIEYVNRKESIELSESDIIEIEKLAKTTTVVDEKTGKEKKITVLDKLVSKLAPSVIGCEHVKKGLLFCAANSGKDSFRRRLRLNALLVGETGLDKSQLLNHAAKLVPKSRFTSATTSSVRSLIGVVDKETDYPFLRLGPIPGASGAICAIDEIGRMSYEDQAQLLNALQEGRIPFGKHGFNLYLDGSATFILSANPNNSSGEWKDPETINYNEIPLLGPLRDRIDLIFIFRTSRKTRDILDYAFKKIEMTDCNDALLKEEEENFDSLIKYIFDCKSRFNPKLSREAKNMKVQYYTSIAVKSGSPRILDTLINLCLASARLCQKETADAEDAKEAIEVYNVQLTHRSQIVKIPSDPRDLAVEELNNTLRGSKYKIEFIELIKTVRKNNQFVSHYIPDNWDISDNWKLREVRTRFMQGNRDIIIFSTSPLVIGWKESYIGDDIPPVNSGQSGGDEPGSNNNINNNESDGSEVSEVSEVKKTVGESSDEMESSTTNRGSRSGSASLSKDSTTVDHSTPKNTASLTSLASLTNNEQEESLSIGYTGSGRNKSDLSDQQNNRKTHGSDISSDNDLQNVSSVTQVTQVTESGAEPSTHRQVVSYSCYYCNGCKTNSQREYERHIVIKHPGKPGYPGVVK